jgi:hypothetical protein
MLLVSQITEIYFVVDEFMLGFQKSMDKYMIGKSL